MWIGTEAGLTRFEGGRFTTVGLPGATDVVDLAPLVASNPASGSLFRPGKTIVEVLASDKASNMSKKTFTVMVTVHDEEPPTIAAHADVIAEATGPARAAVGYDVPATADNFDGMGLATCTPASGSPFPIASSKITCHARDAAGNAAAETFFHVVVRDTTAPGVPSGFYYVRVRAIGAGGASVPSAEIVIVVP